MSEVAQIVISLGLAVLWCLSLGVMALYVWGVIRSERKAKIRADAETQRQFDEWVGKNRAAIRRRFAIRRRQSGPPRHPK